MTSERRGESPEITELLRAWKAGGAIEEDLFEQVFGLLKRIARSHLRRGSDLTLSPTELVNEAYLRLLKSEQDEVSWRDRAQFYGAVSTTMRRVVAYQIKKRRRRSEAASRRGGTPEGMVNALVLEELTAEDTRRKLKEARPELARVVELRVYAGCTTAEIAQIEGIGESTARRRWADGIAWMRNRLERGEKR